MADKFTSIAADRQEYFKCYINKIVTLIDESKVPMCYRNRPARVMFQMENFVVIRFEECEGWAFQVQEISNIKLFDEFECGDRRELKLCIMHDCRRIASKTLDIVQTAMNGNGLEKISIPISLCVECHEQLLKRHSSDEVTYNFITDSDVLFKIEVEK